MENEPSEREVEHTTEEQTFKKGRHRKKQLYNSILQQMEFYFSDSNLTKDRFLSQLLKQNNSVEVTEFLKFNKIRKLTLDVEDIKKAIKKSTLIELSEDKNSIFRKEPIKEKLNVDECTIYVERLKSDATHEWLGSVFSEFGNVVYVSIPKYHHNNVLKGFAFVEFENESEAEKAVSYFESIGCKMPSNIEPSQLCSIATFNNSNENEKSTVSLPENTNKRKISKVEDNNENEELLKKIKTEGGEVSGSEDTETKKKKKLKKEHKKKNYLKELGLQVLSKKEWKTMRNRYLDLQRKKMKEFKQHLYKSKFGKAQYVDKFENNGVEKQCKDKEFEKGLIVKIKLTEPVADTKKFKNDLKLASPEIMYIDVPHVGCEEVYVRFSDTNSAINFCQKDSLGSKDVLSGESEEAYWTKIQTTRESKFNKTKKKVRGRDKLLKKAKHLKFDD